MRLIHLHRALAEEGGDVTRAHWPVCPACGGTKWHIVGGQEGIGSRQAYDRCDMASCPHDVHYYACNGCHTQEEEPVVESTLVQESQEPVSAHEPSAHAPPGTVYETVEQYPMDQDPMDQDPAPWRFTVEDSFDADLAVVMLLRVEQVGREDKWWQLGIFRIERGIGNRGIIDESALHTAFLQSNRSYVAADFYWFAQRNKDIMPSASGEPSVRVRRVL